jgi:hypothetical protein
MVKKTLDQIRRKPVLKWLLPIIHFKHVPKVEKPRPLAEKMDLHTALRYHAKKYTDESRGINHALIHGHELDDDQKEHIKHMDHLTRQHLKSHGALHSGLGFDPRHHMDSKGHLHMKAFTSTTRDPEIAERFARETTTHHDDGSTEHHVIHIKPKPGDKGHALEYDDGHSRLHRHEQETILPRGTTLKVHKTPRIEVQKSTSKWDKRSKIIHHWDAEIHHQEE